MNTLRLPVSCNPSLVHGAIAAEQPHCEFLPSSSTLCFCSTGPEEGDHRGKCTDSVEMSHLQGFCSLPQPTRGKFEPCRARKYVSQCWQAPQYFCNHIVTHGLEQLDKTTGEAFWKAISLAHNIGLTLPEKSMAKLKVILMREEVGQYWKISCTAFIFCHWFLVILKDE